ncbi:MAG: hypothetical protein U0166_29245 [Acidobacteriota bacterium]
MVSPQLLRERESVAEGAFQMEARGIEQLRCADPWVSDGDRRLRRTLWVGRPGEVNDILVFEVEFEEASATISRRTLAPV